MKCLMQVSWSRDCGKEAIAVVKHGRDIYYFCDEHLRMRCNDTYCIGHAGEKVVRRITFFNAEDLILYRMDGFVFLDTVKVKVAK